MDSELKVDEMVIAEWVGSVNKISDEYAERVEDQRDSLEAARFCQWDGQSPDGRKHEENLGKPPLPFEGCSDARIRLADGLVNTRVALLMQAASRAAMQVEATEGGDIEFAARLTTVLNWMVRGRRGARLQKELRKCHQFSQGDSPAVAFMGVYWDQRYGKTVRSVSLADVVEILKGVYAADSEDPAQAIDGIELVMGILMDQERNEEAIDLVASFLPDLEEPDVKEFLRGLREDGEGQFPAEYLKENMYRVNALRLYEDIFVHFDAGDIQDEPEYFTREWLLESQLKERVRSGWYRQEFIDALIGDPDRAGDAGHAGKSAIRTESLSGGTRSVGLDDLKENLNRYEVITRYAKIADDDGAVGVYMAPFSGVVEEPAAFEMTLLDYDHGLYPVVPFTREILNHRLLDSRGVPETALTDQASLKLMNDSKENNVQVATLPPVRRPVNRSRAKIVLAPFGIVEERRPKEIDWMAPPPYPAAAERHSDDVMLRTASYHGIPHVGVPDQITVVMLQDMVNQAMDAVGQVYEMILQLSQQFLTDEDIARITGVDGTPMPSTAEEIQGAFDATVSFDAHDFDRANILAMAEIVKNLLLPMDSKSTIETDKVVSWVFRGLSPSLANFALKPKEAASVGEVEDEQMNWVKMLSGVRPMMQPEGQDAELRLQWLTSQIEETAELIQTMPELVQGLIQERVKHLTFLLQQQQNAQTGLVGVETPPDGIGLS